MLGLVVIITIVKLTSNAMRKLKHARRLGQCEEHLGSKEGLIPDMSDPRLIPLDSSRCGLLKVTYTCVSRASFILLYAGQRSGDVSFLTE
jgi:hypothetical protein